MGDAMDGFFSYGAIWSEFSILTSLLFPQIADLVDSKGADVTVRDEENITCLHWASINNRSELCTYVDT